jgi:hypothetical protein
MDLQSWLPLVAVVVVGPVTITMHMQQLGDFREAHQAGLGRTKAPLLTVAVVGAEVADYKVVLGAVYRTAIMVDIVETMAPVLAAQ